MNKVVKSKITFSVNYSFPRNSKNKKKFNYSFSLTILLDIFIMYTFNCFIVSLIVSLIKQQPLHCL